MNLADWSYWMPLVQDAAPLLPQPSLLPLLRQAGWALVMAALVTALMQCFDARWVRDKGRLLSLAFALWACIPGPWGLSYWLGLAFQTPSLMAIGLASSYLWGSVVQRRWPQSAKYPDPASYRKRSLAWQDRYALVGIAMGWLLLFDVFAYLPWSLYAWGFHPLANGPVLLVALWPWIASGRTAMLMQAPSKVLLPVLALFWVSRWPTGNLWDAVLDPWLFVGLHGYMLMRLRKRQGT
jgi:hypothetical protein